MFRNILILTILAALTATAAAPTFYKDALPILQTHCQECHRAGEAAPFSLMSYREARPWAKAIRAAVATKKMPPWFANPAHGKFSNDRSLPEADLKTLTQWVDQGAKEGNPKDAPAPPQFAKGWAIGTPDLIVEMPQAFTVPAKGTVEYTWIVVPTGLTEDRWVETVEVRPSVREVVHHIVLYSKDKDSKFMSMAQPGVPFNPPGRKGTPPPQKDEGKGFWEFQFNPVGVEIQGLYVPGGAPYTTKPGQARLLKAGSDIVFQMHYTSNGKEAMDKSRVGFRFAKQPPKERVFNTFLANPYMQIPAGDGNAEVRGAITLPMDVTLLSMNPHTHVRGKAFRYQVTYPTGESEILLDVPKYDFNWQISYYLQEPKLLPKGSRLEAIAWYDNSPNNPANPDASKRVFWGDQTWEEMIAAFVDFVVPLDFKPMQLVRGRPTTASSEPGSRPSSQPQPSSSQLRPSSPAPQSSSSQPQSSSSQPRPSSLEPRPSGSGLASEPRPSGSGPSSPRTAQ